MCARSKNIIDNDNSNSNSNYYNQMSRKNKCRSCTKISCNSSSSNNNNCKKVTMHDSKLSFSLLVVGTITG